MGFAWAKPNLRSRGIHPLAPASGGQFLQYAIRLVRIGLGSHVVWVEWNETQQNIDMRDMVQVVSLGRNPTYAFNKRKKIWLRGDLI